MTVKPTVLPRWANVGGVVSTPPSGKQDVGWISGENPPSAYFNWLGLHTYNWAAFVDAFFTSGGSAVGEATLASSAEATTAPVMSFSDYKAKSRQHIDHLGYLGGQVTNWYEQWRTTGTTEPALWTYGGTQTRAYSDPDANMPYRNVAMTLAASASVTVFLDSAPVAYIDNDRAYVAELDVRTGSSNWTGTNILQFKWMVQFSHSAAWDQYVALQLNPNNQANVTANTVGMATGNTQTASAVAVAVSTTYRLRMEIIGSNCSSQAAGTYTARFYVNGALIATHTFTITQNTDKIRHEIGLSNGGTALAGSVQVGPIRSSWNHRLTQDLV